MSEIRTLTEYANEILANKSNPGMLAELYIELATKYAFISEIAKDLQIEKAIFWNDIGKLSDAKIENKWRVTEGGNKEIKLKYELRALEKLMAAIKSSIVVNSLEARNLT